MAFVLPFRALRPRPDLAARVAALPYDVMDVAEARAMAAGSDVSFLHVSRPEIDLPNDVDPYDDAVYAQGRANLDSFIERGALVTDATPTFTIYRQRMGDHVQTGIVGLAAVDDYESGVIARHELTRPDKELDRVRHIDALEAQDEPVFLLCPRHDEIEAVIAQVTAGVPDIDIVTDDGIGHTLWIVAGDDDLARVSRAFAQMPRLYVADGHHRSAAAARVRDLRRQRGLTGDGWQGHDGFLVVVFAADQLAILPYHRVVADLGGLTGGELLAQLERRFSVSPSDGPPSPSGRHVIGMYLPQGWYRLVLRDGQVDEANPVARLDVSVLQDFVLAPLLGIGDPRLDARLRFVGGIRGTGELERLVRAGAGVAFALHPTSVDDLMALADEGRVMPPKSTWFEPKLRSGLFLHSLR
ncbi:MAG: DUF1015 family protein [Candidatus Nanopelagicales bacterium]|nr:DUF1015 family protein [Candidatus Nanopelagicales bacterium]